MKLTRIAWLGTMLTLIVIAIGQVQHSHLGAALAIIGISLVMFGMSMLAEWYAERSS